MLQRVQTLFLLLAACSQAILFFMAREVTLWESTLFVKAIAVTAVFFSIFSIFSYRKRTRQILLNNFNIFINALLTGLLVYWLLNLSGGDRFPEKGIELTFPLVSLLCLFLANLYIKKDEKLVKSVDRIR